MDPDLSQKPDSVMVLVKRFIYFQQTEPSEKDSWEFAGFTLRSIHSGIPPPTECIRMNKRAFWRVSLSTCLPVCPTPCKPRPAASCSFWRKAVSKLCRANSTGAVRACVACNPPSPFTECVSYGKNLTFYLQVLSSNQQIVISGNGGVDFWRYYWMMKREYKPST